MENKNIIIGTLIALLVVGFGYYNFFDKEKVIDKSVFQKKQECAQYGDLVKTKIEKSGRVFGNDTYAVKEVFYSPKLDTCLYAWVIHTTLEPTEIYSIDDIFGTGIFTTGISENAETLFDEEIIKLKKNTRITTKNKLEDNFARNQDCLKYKNEIAEKLSTKESAFGDMSLEQIFYSPMENSCLYVEYGEEKSGLYSKHYSRRLLDILNDGYNSDPLEACFSFHPSAEIRETYKGWDNDLVEYTKDRRACDDFDEVIDKYK